MTVDSCNVCYLYTDQTVDGDTFSTLPTDKNGLNTEIGCTLTLGGSNRLCKLIQQLHKGVFERILRMHDDASLLQYPVVMTEKS